MSTVLHPVGPSPARVYWRRRLVLLAAVVLAVVLLAAAVGALRGGGGQAQDLAGGTEPAVVATGDDAEGAEGADEAPDEEPAGPVACAPADLTVTVASDARAYPAGSVPTLTVAVTNSGTVGCTADVGAAEREVVVMSGEDRIWSSRDCAAGDEERLVLLEPGARDEVPLTWDRTRSAEGCPAGLPAPLPGTYTATASVLGATSAAAVFDLG